jgi:lysyl endopeptidase
MKKNLLLITFIFSLCIVFSQTENLGKPYSFLKKVNITKKSYKIENFNNLELYSYYSDLNKNTGNKLLQYGHAIDVELDLFKISEKFKLANNKNIYQFKLESENAISLNLIFSDFKLEQGTIMYVFTEDKSQFIGAYTSLNNNEQNSLGTELLYSNKIVVEIQEPIENENKSRLKIGKIIHGFIHLDNYLEKELNASGSCNIDVNCPQGMGWETPRNSVALMLNGAGGFCTGTLVNNTSGNLIPYFLTANHCGTDPSNWVFRFRYESPQSQADCGTTSPSVDGPTNMSINGGVSRAKSQLSDFHLVELNSSPLEEWNVVYNGWDRTNISAQSGAGIHHPRGDVKKISISNLPFESYTFSGQENYWRVYWEEGVTESGSSGSPIFNPQRRIVGQLFGGTSGCTSSDQSDLYGKFSASWTGGGTNETRLSNWLDPQNTGLEFIDGNVVNAIDPYLINSVLELEKTICGNSTPVKVILFNGGTVPLSSATLNYSVNGENFTQDWTGNLGFHEFDTISILNINLIDGMNQFVATITNPNNGQIDNVLTNNSIFKNFMSVQNGENLQLNLNLDCFADETSWKIVDMNNNIYYEDGDYLQLDSGYTVSYDICLNEGCYDFHIFDSYGDGLTSNNCDTGSYYITRSNNDTILAFSGTDAIFTYSSVRNFCAETASLLENDKILNLNVYPNPSNGIIFIEADQNIVSFKLLDISGKQLIIKENVHSKQFKIDEKLNPGVYFIEMKTLENKQIRKIIVN